MMLYYSYRVLFPSALSILYSVELLYTVDKESRWYKAGWDHFQTDSSLLKSLIFHQQSTNIYYLPWGGGGSRMRTLDQKCLPFPCPECDTLLPFGTTHVLPHCYNP